MSSAALGFAQATDEPIRLPIVEAKRNIQLAGWLDSVYKNADLAFLTPADSNRLAKGWILSAAQSKRELREHPVQLQLRQTGVVSGEVLELVVITQSGSFCLYGTHTDINPQK